jgi:hypothetical protein
MNDLDPRDGYTWAFGPEPMLIEDRGVVEHECVKPDGTKYILRYRVGVLKPIESAK